MPRNRAPANNLYLFPEFSVEVAENAGIICPRKSKLERYAELSVIEFARINPALRVILLQPEARVPAVAHPGEDLGYDVFALEPVTLPPRRTTKIRTGIAVEARHPETGTPLGLLVRDRSSMAAKGLACTGGVIDAGYRGEILIVMTNLGEEPIQLNAGEKIAQMVPVPVLTGPIEEVENLEVSARQGKGFGSSGI